MNDMNEFYKKIQMYLMKKSQEYGELKLLKAVTDENTNQINDICKSVTNIFETYNIPIGEKASVNNRRCVESYKYLLLNTNFENHERLAEDIASGHLVDMCPSLSEYLFIQILLNLEYEKILIESLLYVPFDLCIEILKLIPKHIDKLPFRRSVAVIYRLMSVIYIKFFQLMKFGIQTKNIEESIKSLLLNFEEFLLLLNNPELSCLKEVSSLKKCERQGIMLKKLLMTAKTLLENRKKEILISEDLEKLYKITFGTEAFVKCESTLMQSTISKLNQQLMDFVQNKIKEVDCNTYISWTELDDDENITISLQRSIGIESYYFREFILKDEELSENTSLIEILQHLSSKPDPKQSSFVLSLEELCCVISNGKTEGIVELLYRYKEWDRSILNFIYDNRSLLDKKGYLTLLEYLTFILRESTDEDLKEFSYTLVMKILAVQSIPDLYEIIMMYLTRYDGKSCLELPHTEEAFHEFIIRNANLKIATNLKTVLLFVLKNPRMVLTTLLKITIGHLQYRNIMISPTDLLLLSPFMQIKEDNDQLFLTSILRTICIENTEWNSKKFGEFLEVILNSSIIKVDGLINNVFVPYLKEDSFNASNIISITNNIRKLQVKCTKDMNAKDLIIALAKRMSSLRKDTSISRYISSEIFVQIKRILLYFLENRDFPFSTKKEIICGIESVIEPADKLYFASLWYLMQKDVTVLDIIQDYGSRCFVLLNKLKDDSKTSEKLRNYLLNLNLQKEDFLRHLIIRSTDDEYKRLGTDLVLVYWFAFGWKDKIDAYDHFLRLTIEACCLSLEYPSIGGSDLFPFLIQSFTHFCTMFVCIKGIANYEQIYQSLIRNIKKLDESIKYSPYAHLFTSCLSHLNDNTADDPINILQDVLNTFNHFSDKCLKIRNEYDEKIQKISHSPKVSNFYITHEVISACMKVPAKEAHECINRMNELFLSD
ncbi:uncharacterized protein LOC143428036 [Xylocopa sonorina]|uniref:uncharacterized protein LOC143428036 n=1 Tax=Xylocopa sonorina TaxID=1818115 RepID=UPI00403B08DA